MFERKKSRSAKKSAKNRGARKIKERGRANSKAQNLRPKKERESASAKSSAQERESTSVKRKKKRVPSSGYTSTVGLACLSQGLPHTHTSYLVDTGAALSLLSH